MHSITAAALLLLSAASQVAAAPADTPLSGMHVYIRGEDSSYSHSEEMANKIRAEQSDIEKRSSHAKVQVCKTSSCTECKTVFDQTFSSNSACIAAENTACLIISNGDNANVEFWNKAGCNGNHSVQSACSSSAIKRTAPGTNSIGVHTGC